MRKNSFHAEKISIEEHRQWFEEQKFLYLFRDQKGELMGQVRLNDMDEKSFQISINLAAEFRGKKLSPKFIEKALSLFPSRGTIVAWIKVENIPSLRAFSRAGFRTIKEEVVYGTLSIRMERKC